MPTGLKQLARDRVDAVLGAVGLQRRRQRSISDFLDLRTTLARADEAGLSVGDFIDATYSEPGTSQRTVDELRAFGVFKDPIERVCEIGPGSGRYLEKTLSACCPAHYEVYETARDWAEWLGRTYPVVVRPTDGVTLAHTPSGSIDLVQAHKVFIATPSMTTIRYFIEMARVTRERGSIVFDVLTEDCLDRAALRTWLEHRAEYDTYPAFMPKRVVVDLFADQHISFEGSFLVPLVPGNTECMVFRRTS